MPKICLECKYGVVGKYQKVYKGRPIGCDSPGTYCSQNGEGPCGMFEPKEDKNEVRSQ